MKDLIELIIKKLVEHPEDVQVRAIEGDEGLTIEVQTNPEDMGRVIGKSGKTAQAIRTLLNASAAKAGMRVVLRILE